MPATKTELIGGGFQDSEGNALANGYLKMHLSQDCTVTGVGNICSGIDITIQLDSNGNAVAGQYVWSNLVLSPQNNYYRVTGYSAAGQKAWGPNNQQVGSGATYNLDLWVPNTVISWFPTLFQPTQPLLVEIAGTPTSNQTLINFESSDASVTITNPSGGIINLQAAGGGSKFPGVWLGNNAAGIVGFNLLDGSNIGIAFQPFNSSTPGAINPSATNLRCVPVIPDSTNCGGVGDGELDITTGILQDWIMKVGITGLSIPYRYWIGMTDQSLVSIESAFFTDTPAANFIGFRLSSIPDGTTLQAICQTDSSHQTVVSTGVVAADAQIFEIIPSNSGATITFKINGTAVATITTNVPTNSTAMAGFLSVDYDSGVVTSNAQANYYYYYFLLSN